MIKTKKKEVQKAAAKREIYKNNQKREKKYIGTRVYTFLGFFGRFWTRPGSHLDS
jgi:hypothetical protein